MPSNKLTKIKDKALIIYPIIVIVCIPLLLIANTLWNLKAFSRDVNFIIRHQAVGIANSIKPAIERSIQVGGNLSYLLDNTKSSNEEIVDLVVLSIQGDNLKVIESTGSERFNNDAINSDLNKFADGLDESFAGLKYDPDTQKNLWNVSVPFELDGESYVVFMKMSVDTVDEILSRTSRDSYIVLGVLVFVTLVLLINHFVFYKKAQKTKQLEEVGKLKDEFLSMAAHELKAPITGLTGYLELLQDKLKEYIKDDSRKYIDTLNTLIADLKKLIDDLLDVSRIEQGRLKVEKSETDVNDVIKTVVESLKPAAETKGLEIKLSLGDLPTIQSDPNRIRQIVTNLLSNSIKYTIEGWVEIKTWAKDQKVTIEVSDSGIGIPADKLPNLFSKFERIKDQKTQEVRGTGLGLWITKQLVEILGGKISAESIYGTGTKILFFVPLN